VMSASETVQIDAVTGPIAISGTASSAMVIVYGVCSSVTSTATGVTVNNYAAINQKTTLLPDATAGAAGGVAIVGSEMTLTDAYDAAKTAAQAGDLMTIDDSLLAKTTELPDITGLEAALVKLLAAGYNSATINPATGEITLSNGTTQTVTTTGRVTVEGD